MSWAGAQDDEIQRSGFVAVALNVGVNRTSFESLPYLVKIKSIEQAVPYRYNAFHYVYDQPWMYPFVTAVPFLFNERINEKFIPHYCSKLKYTVLRDCLTKRRVVSSDTNSL